MHLSYPYLLEILSFLFFFFVCPPSSPVKQPVDPTPAFEYFVLYLLFHPRTLYRSLHYIRRFLSTAILNLLPTHFPSSLYHASFLVSRFLSWHLKYPPRAREPANYGENYYFLHITPPPRPCLVCTNLSFMFFTIFERRSWRSKRKKEKKKHTCNMPVAHTAAAITQFSLISDELVNHRQWSPNLNSVFWAHSFPLVATLISRFLPLFYLSAQETTLIS